MAISDPILQDADIDPLDSQSIPVGASGEHLMILRLKRMMDADVHGVLARHSELSLAQWRLLSVLSRAEGKISQKELVHRTYITQGQASRALFKLQNEGMVLASQSEQDRRSWDYSVTSKGKENFLLLLPHMEARKASLDGALTAEERDSFQKIMIKIARVVQGRLNNTDKGEKE